VKTISILLVLAMAVPAFAGRPSKHDHQQAEKMYDQALKQEAAGELEKALDSAVQAAELAPANVEYATTRELLRQQLASRHLAKGNELAELGDTEGAVREFTAGLAFDPQNSYLLQRLQDVSPPPQKPDSEPLVLLASVEQMALQPGPGKHSFHVRGATPQMLFQQIGQAFGISMVFDNSVTPSSVRFDVDDVDFYTAMKLAGRVTKTFWSALSPHQAIIAADKLETRRDLERIAVRSFKVSDAVTDADLNDVLNMVRVLFDVRYISTEHTQHLLTLRAPAAQMQAIAGLLQELLQPRPEVVLDVKAYELDTDKLRKIGLLFPTDFQIFNITAELRRVLGSDADAIIDQFEQTGTIDPTKIAPGALANLQNSPLLAPFLFFGKGLGLTGITIPNGIAGQLAQNNSYTSTLEHVLMRAQQGEASTFRVGTRYPIATSVFSNVAVTATGNASVGSAVPSFQYQDVGLTLKTTPFVQSSGHVRLNLELQVEGIGAQQLVGIPVITDREFKGNVTLREGESAVITGSVTEQQAKMAEGYPGLGQLPLLKEVLNANTREHIHNEVLIVVTPHLVRRSPHEYEPGRIWMVD